MKVTYVEYDYYVDQLKKAKSRMNRDRMIIKHVQQLINTKNLIPSSKQKLDGLIIQQTN
jgi:hypothetical protein